MRLREYIYSLLLLTIISIGGGGAFSTIIYHCNIHNIEADHHHCSHIGECSSHDLRYEHKCAVDRKPSFEYIRSNPQRLSVAPLVYYIVAILNCEDVESVEPSTSPIDEWRSFNLYRGYDPTISSLRAPPALV